MEYVFKLVGSFTLLMCMSVSVSLAEDKHHHPNSEITDSVESLSLDIRKLLSKEMREIQKGMISIIPAYSSGDWGKIEEIAYKIERSYIFKQSLTEKQIEELHNSLPSQFIELDNQFHYFSGMLSHAAKNRKPELVGFYFSRMTELCVSCHSKFATHKFRGLVESRGVVKHSH